MRTKSFLCSLAVAFLVAVNCGADGIVVTLLGTGSPIPRVDRFGPATLVEAGGQRLLFDCGRGATIRLWQTGRTLSSVDVLFLTHLHSDHTVGIPDLWLTGWLGGRFGHRTGAFRVRGPKGTKKMMNALVQAYSWDIRTRVADEHLSRTAVAVDAADVAEGVVYQQNGVKVTAFPVDHGPLIRPSLGYRVDYGGHSVVLSGDTRPNENLVRHAAGADVLIHEVAMASPEMMTSEAAKRVIAHHTTPADAGRIFDRVKPRLAVYSHVVLLSMERDQAEPTVAEVVEATRSTWKGPLEVGVDLMKIEIGGEIRVTRP